MSIQVANINLASAVVGTTGAIKFGGATPPPTITQQMRPQSAPGYTLLIQNESGCGLTCTFPLTNKSLSIRAGDGRTVHVPPGETELDYTVSYVLPNAPVSRLLVDLYIPGEAVDSIGALGNSPIGVSGITTLSTKIPINTTGGNVVAIEMGPDTATASDWEFIVEQTTGNLLLFDNLRGKVIWKGVLGGLSTDFFEVVQALNLDKAVNNINGQAAAGNLGIPVNANVTRSIAVTTTGSATILTYMPTSDGYYRVSACARVNNSVSGQLLSLAMNWTELDTSTAVGVFLVTGITPFNGSNSIPNGTYPMHSDPILAKAGGNTITITYNDPGGIPNDKISIAIERID